MNDNILFQESTSEYDVNIIIGENGSGKSNYLNLVAKGFIESGSKVIAIATSVHDKFDIRSRRFHFFGGRQGRNMVEKLVKKNLTFKSDIVDDRIRNLVRILEYSGFETRIGLTIEGYSLDNKYLLENDLTINDSDKEELLSLLINHGSELCDLYLDNKSDMMSLNLVGLTTNNIHGTVLSLFLKYEKLLKKHNIISKISLYLEKEYHSVALNEASSGELTMISTLMHISSHIDENSVIIIDEPENSLHPKWQREYISKILDLFYYYRPKIIIASHSPLVIPLRKEESKLFKLSDYKLMELDRTTGNHEEIMSEVFGVLTPENRYLSDYIIDLLNKYDADEIDYKFAMCEILKKREKIYDPRQNEFIDGVVQILNKISKSKGGIRG